MGEKLVIANALNLLNVTAFGIIAFTTFVLIVYSNDYIEYFEFYDQTKTFLHPAKACFYLGWISIFLSQCCFVYAQLTPKYRNSAVVQYGIQHFYFLASLLCLMQVRSSSKVMHLGIEFMLAVTLFLLLKCQNITLKLISSKENNGYLSFFDLLLLRTPFGIHFGWSLMRFSIEVSNYLDFQKFSNKEQFDYSMVLLFFNTLCSIILIWNKYPVYSTAGFIAYSMIAFAAGDMPDDPHAKTFKIIAGFLAVFNASLIPARYYAHVSGRFEDKNKKQGQKD
uniref:Uncharacterized protein n=1 Tax=Eucampia antarctica TaxID=49252 RepID=A0A7S2R6T7_9STRA|mmetsp:Transcript_180/g.186  ORF Transcript_180/g.186 Transcript_180/m.186 type:complete len:280 (+) Transcript_180:35-874(+)